jgi:hypothetical protein
MLTDQAPGLMVVLVAVVTEVAMQPTTEVVAVVAETQLQLDKLA